ncbi:MAG: nitrite/sulfite reductase [Pseudomonadota bacterium]
MYRYDEFDHTFVRERVAEFRSQVERRLSGDLTEDQFKPLRLMNGVYLQLHAYMLRVAIPYGTLSPRQLHALADIADKYDKGYGHLTTRQNIQFNWPALVDIPDLLDDLANVEMHAIQTSGNCIRNVTTDQYAGAAADEIEDPRPWCEIIRQWSTLHPEFSFLPRKFKIAVNASESDRAAFKFHYIGLRLQKNDAGKTGFEVIVGGGLGRTPYVGMTIREFLPPEHLLSYLEAVLRVYNERGRRDNLYKARIKILVNAMGLEAFREAVEEEWLRLKDRAIDLPEEERARIAAYFSPPSLLSKSLPSKALSEIEPAKEEAGARFQQWRKANTVAHKAPGHRIVNISLKPVGGAPGDVTSEQMRLIAGLGEDFSHGEVRTTHEQNFCLPHVHESNLYAVYTALDVAGLATPNIGLASDIIACPGLDYCNLANTRSIPIAQRIAKRVAARGDEEKIGELKIKISGCINACGHHHVGHIGILGVDKKGEEFYQITLGGSAAEDAAIGEIVGRGLSSAEVVDAVERLIDFYTHNKTGDERFLDAYRRLGADAFKEAIYANA